MPVGSGTTVFRAIRGTATDISTSPNHLHDALLPKNCCVIVWILARIFIVRMFFDEKFPFYTSP